MGNSIFPKVGKFPFHRVGKFTFTKVSIFTFTHMGKSNFLGVGKTPCHLQGPKKPGNSVEDKTLTTREQTAKF